MIKPQTEIVKVRLADAGYADTVTSELMSGVPVTFIDRGRRRWTASMDLDTKLVSHQCHGCGAELALDLAWLAFDKATGERAIAWWFRHLHRDQA